MQKVVVVGGDHHNTLSLVRALGSANYHVILIVVAANPKSFVTHSKYASESYIVDSEKDVLDLLRTKHNASKERIPIITASDQSAEFLDKHFDELSEFYILANCGNKQDGISKWMDKENMLHEARKCGLTPPFSLFIEENATYNVDGVDIPFPCVVKPLKSSIASKDDFRVCNDLNNLREVLSDMEKRHIPIAIQEFVKVDYEFLIIGARCRKTKKNHIVGGLHKHKCCKDTNNMGMFVSGETTEKIPHSIDISKLDVFLDAIDYEGLYSLEFMIASEKAYFTEINLRNDGCLFCWTNAGCNMAASWCEEMKTGKSVRYDNLLNKNMLVEISYLKYYHNNLYTMFKDFQKADAYAIFDKHDIKPFLYKFLNVIK